MNQLCRVQILTQTETRLEYVKKSSFVIGRADNADVVIDDAAVSGGHFGVKVVDNEIFVADLDSRNGTWIGQKKLSPHRLTPCTGEAIHFGSEGTTINFELVSAAVHATTPSMKLPPLPVLASNTPKLPLHPTRPPIPAPIPAAVPIMIQKSETVTVAMKEIRPVGVVEMAAHEEGARQKSDEIIAKAKADAVKESEKIIAEGQLKIKGLKTDWESGHQNRIELENKKLNGLKMEAEKIILEATNEAGAIKKNAEKFLAETQSKAKSAADKMNVTATTEIEADIAEARKKAEKIIALARQDAEKIKAESQNFITEANSKAREVLTSIEKQKKDADLLQNEARKAADAQKRTAELQGNEILKRAELQAQERIKAAEADATRLKDAATKAAKEEVARLMKNQDTHKEKLAGDLEKLQQQLGLLTNDKVRLAAENKRLDEKVAASKAALKEADEEFLAAETEYTGKISSLDKKLKSAQAQFKDKTAEMEGQMTASRKTFEGAHSVEKDLKNLRDQREKLLKSIDDLKKLNSSSDPHKSNDAASTIVRSSRRSTFKQAMSASLGLVIVATAVFAWKYDILHIKKQMSIVAAPQGATAEARTPAASIQEKEIPVTVAVPVAAAIPVTVAPQPPPVAAAAPAPRKKAPAATLAASAPAPEATAKLKIVLADNQPARNPAPRKPRKIEKYSPPQPSQEPIDSRQRDVDQLKFGD